MGVECLEKSFSVIYKAQGNISCQMCSTGISAERGDSYVGLKGSGFGRSCIER